jgi:Holliday junction resolvase
MEGGSTWGVPPDQPNWRQQQQRAHLRQPSSTLSYQSDLKADSVEVLAVKKKSDRKKKFRASEVEYLVADTRKWTGKARIAVNAARCRCYKILVGIHTYIQITDRQNIDFLSTYV